MQNQKNKSVNFFVIFILKCVSVQLPPKVASMPLLKSFSSPFVIHYIDQKKNLTTSMLLLNSFGHIPAGRAASTEI